VLPPPPPLPPAEIPKSQFVNEIVQENQCWQKRADFQEFLTAAAATAAAFSFLVFWTATATCLCLSRCLSLSFTLALSLSISLSLSLSLSPTLIVSSLPSLFLSSSLFPPVYLSPSSSSPTLFVSSVLLFYIPQIYVAVASGSAVG